MPITNSGTTSTIDSTFTAAQLEAVAATGGLEPNVVITRDAGTPAGDAVGVNFTSLTGAQLPTSITVQNGASAVIGAGLLFNIGTTAPTLNVSGGTLEISDTASLLGTTSTVNVGASGGVIRVDPVTVIGTLNVPVAFTGTIPNNFTVDFASASSVTGNYSSLTGNTTLTSLTVSILGSSFRTVTIPGNVFNLAVNVNTTFNASDGSGGVLVCFLPGALIATPDGERAVETLRSGDEVWALEGGERVARRLVWAGERSVDVARDTDGSDVRPIRVSAGAFAPGVPHTDLLVTPEHCFLFDGRLVPARMLVNHRTVTVADEFSRFTVHHVETETHSVIIANGAPTESYLDTGNRSGFRQPGVVVSLGAMRRCVRSWAEDAAAPLAVDAAFVEPIWRALDARADALDVAAASGATQVTTDPDLHLVTEGGRAIRPLYQRNNRAVFTVPGDVGTFRLASRASRPADAIGPWIDDRRTLGVLVGEVALWTTGGRELRRAHLDDARLPGWHALEAGPHRWTDGTATLSLAPLRPTAMAVMVEIEVLAGGPYLVETAPAAGDSRRVA